MTRIFNDPTDDMPDLASRVDRRLLLGMGVAFAVWLGTFAVTAHVAYSYGASTTAPICEGDSVSLRKVPTVWPRGPVAGARP